MKKVEKKDLVIDYIEINLIKECEYNPRKISPKQKKELIESIEKFGIREPLKVNTFEGREMVLISGHQRFKIAKSMGFDKIPVTYEYLTLEEEKEMNLRMNKNGGEFDLDLVNQLGDREFLLNIGFATKELPQLYTEFEKEFNAITDPVYPISPKFNEKYDYVMIFCKSEMDYTWLSNCLKIERKKDYKNNNIHECHVITVEEFQTLHEAWTN